MDIFEDAIVPETPKVLPNEQLFVYVPIGTIDYPGIVTFDDIDFRIDEHGRVYMKASSIKNAKDIRDIFALLYGYREGEPAEGKEPGPVMASIKAVYEKAKANAEAIKGIAGAITSRGSFVIPADDWEDTSPDRAVAVFPAETFGNGDVVIVSPADDATREAAKAAGLFIRMAMSGDCGSADDQIMLVRTTTGVKPTADLTFAYAVLHTDSEAAALVTLVGVDANDSGTSLSRVTETGEGGNVNVAVKNNTIYSISGYNTITILPPEGNYTAHLFVEFPSAAEAVGFVLPKDMEVSGNDPSTAAKGERWEVSLDSMGGAIFLRKAAS